MAYKEKYPLDITPQGDTVPESIKKNRDELLNIAQQMELKAGGGGTGGGGGLRNRVLSGKVSNGEFSFLTGDNLSVMIDAVKRLFLYHSRTVSMITAPLTISKQLTVSKVHGAYRLIVHRIYILNVPHLAA